jgi:hypothetical protein
MARDLTFSVYISYCDHGAHLTMSQQEHDTDGLDCWCGPRYSLPCDECEVEVAPADDASERIYERGAGCWKCEGGTIRLTREQAEHADAPLVIVHND